MRTPQRVEQFHKELEIKRAKAARDALRSQQDSAGLKESHAVESTVDTVLADPEIAPAAIEDTPDLEAAPAVDPEVSQDLATEAESAVEAPIEPSVEAPVEFTEVTTTASTRKRRS